ncbi:hypothetical protein [Micromonospora carbonacea]|uniref:Uncharacterized protein n=1 Tax=Micromonospora carbonacea TaxID=47853 RepID=A0A1C4V4F0_9ACTN|nr:hypothetical protein [Micromonospora carbonacea]SCE78872.1 hypothetical protein GA0070563_10225 [Micromonospora carbonacea]
MTFPLEALPVTVKARAETWARLGMRWHTHPIQPNHGKAVVVSEFESTTWLAAIIIWATGEAELTTVRLADDRMVNKHYELESRDDLERLLDELSALIADDRVPEAAVIVQAPGTPA